MWSQLQVRGVAASEVTALVQRIRAGRTLADFPNEVRTHKARMLDLVRSGQVHDAYALVQSLPPDLRAAVKPFFTHFTAGRTTEIVTAYAVAEIVAALVAGEQRALPAQVLLDGEWLGSARGHRGAGDPRARWVGACLSAGIERRGGYVLGYGNGCHRCRQRGRHNVTSFISFNPIKLQGWMQQ